MLRCLECQTENPLTPANCRNCGASLRPAHAWLQLDQAETEFNAGHYAATLQLLNQASFAISSTSPELRSRHLLAARAAFLQGSLHYSSDRLAEAETVLLQATQELTDPALGQAAAILLARILNRLGNVAYYRENNEAAINYYQAAERVATAVNDHGNAARAVNNLGNLAVESGHLAEAVACYQRGLRLAEQGSDTSSLAQAYTTLAWLHSHHGPYSKALAYAAQALAIEAQVPNLATRAQVLAEAASVYLLADQFAEAETSLLLARDIIEQDRDKLAEELVMITLAELARRREDYPVWLSYIERAANATSSAILKQETGTQLALYYIATGDLSKASRQVHLLKNQGRNEATIDHYGYPLSRVEALLHTARENWPAAEESYRTALSGEQFSLYNQAETWVEYATMLTAQGTAEAKEAADAALQEAIKLYRQLDLPARRTALKRRLRQLNKVA